VTVTPEPRAASPDGIVPSVMLVAGEASADMYGAGLVQALRAARPDLVCWGAGGAEMRAAGFRSAVEAESLAVAGLTEVLFSLPRLWRHLRRLARLAAVRRPQVVVLIDLPDFNLRLAKRLKPLGIPVIYYVSPQVWAWRPSRVAQIRERVTQMLCILPFEPAFYRQHGVRALFVGHPLVRLLPDLPDRNKARAALGLGAESHPIVALLPGSRPKEVSRHLPIMLAGMRLLRRRFPNAGLVVPTASTVSRRKVDAIVRRSRQPVTVVEGQATAVLAAADAAVVCSGTATIQAALLSRPMVVVYKVSWLTFQILKRLVKVAHIAMVNLIAERRLVPELVQGDFTPEAVDAEVGRLLEDAAARIRLNQDFAQIRRTLGSGDATANASRAILGYLPERHKKTEPAPGTLAPVRAVDRG